MLIVHVHVHVKPESVADFRQATIENARSSVQEPGIAGFDVVEQQDDATRFVLIEVYRTPEAAAAHKETAHYAKWRDEVADMMAEPRHGVKYNDVFPNPRIGRTCASSLRPQPESSSARAWLPPSPIWLDLSAHDHS
jgi:quinol monooxygenase YgiN